MNDTLTRLVGLLQEQEAGWLHGRKVIVVAPVLAAATARVAHHREVGVVEQLVVAFGDGTGPLPTGDDLTVIRLDYDAPVRSVMDELAGSRRVLNEPSTALLAEIDRFDPDRAALVVNSTPTASADRVFGRRLIGGRSLADEALEDKTLCGSMFRSAGVDVAPEEIVPASPEALRDSASRLDQGDGVVVSSDASQGMNGGAAKVWWVRPGTDPSAVFDEVAVAGDTARVMPFLEGQSCSIHGLVTGAGVIVLRPVELCMLRPAGGSGFVQTGISSWWDPRGDGREQMRTAARRVGEVLAHDHGYRGAFGVDGILTRDGFRPHELNPRFSGGINTVAKGVEVPLTLLDQALRLGVDLDIDIADVERGLLEAADAHRFGSAYQATASMRPTQTTSLLVAGSPDDLTTTEDDDEAVGTLELGPAAKGALVRFTPSSLRPGDRLTPWAAAALTLADRLWDTGFGLMEQPVEFR